MFVTNEGTRKLIMTHVFRKILVILKELNVINCIILSYVILDILPEKR